METVIFNEKNSVKEMNSDKYQSKLEDFPCGYLLETLYPNQELKGYIVCDGRRLKINTYPNLFSKIKWTYSPKIDAKYFYIPNLSPFHQMKV